MSDIIIAGFALKRKHDGAYLGPYTWTTKFLPNLYESPRKIKSLYKVRPGGIFPDELLKIEIKGGGLHPPYTVFFSKHNYKQYSDKLKELEKFAETEFEIVKMEISTKEVP